PAQSLRHVIHFLAAIHHQLTLHSSPTRRSSDLCQADAGAMGGSRSEEFRTQPRSARTPSWSPTAVTPPMSRPTSPRPPRRSSGRSEEHTSELQSRFELVCRLLLEKKKENTAEVT